MKTVLSLIFLCILFFCAWGGYKRGVIMSVFSLVAIVLSVYGARLLAVTYSGEITDALRPFASGFVEVNIVDHVVRPAMGMENENLSVNDYFSQNPGKEEEFCYLTYVGMGLHDATSEQLTEEALSRARMTGADIIDAVVDVLCEKVAFVGVFTIAFLMILILLTAIGNIPNLSFRIPNLELFDSIGGLVLGFLQGIAFCIMIGWLLKFAGLLIPQETLSDTFLVSWFMDRTLLVRYLGI